MYKVDLLGADPYWINGVSKKWMQKKLKTNKWLIWNEKIENFWRKVERFECPKIEISSGSNNPRWIICETSNQKG